MTVAELRAALADLPDAMIVVVEYDNAPVEVVGARVSTAEAEDLFRDVGDDQRQTPFVILD